MVDGQGLACPPKRHRCVRGAFERICSKRVTRKAWPIVLVVLYGIILAATARVGTPEQPVPPAPVANLLDKPLGEDAFYMFSVARSLAEGHGLTYGGTPTTGVQPLAAFLYAGLYWTSARAGLPDTFPLRAVILTNVLLLLLTGVLSGRLVARRLRAMGARDTDALWIVPTLVVVNPAAFRLFEYGLETGLYLALIVALQLAVEARRGWFTTGLLLGLCLVARLDFAVIGAVVFGWRLVTRRLRISEAIPIAIVALVVVGPWMWHVYQLTGGVMPSSGMAESGMPTAADDLALRAWTMTTVMAVATTAVLYIPLLNQVLNTAIVVVAAALCLILWQWPPFRPHVRAEGPWFAGAVVLAGYYVLTSTATHFYGRYLAPFWLVWVQLAGTAIVLAALQDRARRVVMSTAACILLVVLFALEIGYTLHRGRLGNPHLATAFYVTGHAGELGTVGAFQSGLVGYESHERVVNLDGKVDGRALSWRGHEECYLAERGITTVIDWPTYIENGWLDRGFVRTRMREIGRVAGGHSVIMHVDTAGLRCTSP